MYREVKVHRVDSADSISLLILYYCLFIIFECGTLFINRPNAVFLVGLICLLSKSNRNKGIKWEFLIEQDERRMTAFYRLANMFTDVPKLKNKVKRREWLDGLLYGNLLSS